MRCGRTATRGHHPVPGPGLLDTEIDHDDVDAGELGQVRVVDAHPGVEHLTEHQHFAGPLRELAQDTLPVVSVTALGSIAVTRSIGTKMRSTGGQFDDEAEHPGLLADDADADHDIADTADGLAVRAQHHQAREPGRDRPCSPTP